MGNSKAENAEKWALVNKMLNMVKNAAHKPLRDADENPYKQ